MFKEINKELEKLQQGVNRRNKIESMLISLDEQLDQQEEKAQVYKKELDEEQIDVDRLNKTTITALFYTILGSKEEQLEKERQESLSARLRYEDIQTQIEDTKYQITKLEAEKAELEYCENAYEELFNKKYQMLKNQSGIHADKIAEIEHGIVVLKSNMKEIQEAIDAGQLVIEEIDNTRRSLDNAEGWGLWDMFGGGGLITNMVKHSHIDDAKETASKVQRLLNRFRTELSDVKVSSEICININEFHKFADFFFDGLISDWLVQSQIQESIESVDKVRQEVTNVIDKLNQMMRNCKEKHTTLEEELEKIVEYA
jgi:DNA repair exonuclease SbcCD ATPase subunit